MGHTWMFLPGEPGKKLFAGLFGWIKPKGLALVVCYLMVMAFSLATAFGLRSYALEQLPQAEVDGVHLVSVYPRPADKLQSLYALALTSPKVRNFLKDNPTYLIYIMPGDFFLTGLILQEGPRFSEQMLTRYPYLRNSQKNKHKGDLIKFFRLGYKFFRTIGTTRRVYDYERLVFVKALTVDGQAAKGELTLQVGITRLPTLVIDIDAETDEILSVIEVSGNNAWGRLPMPNI